MVKSIKIILWLFLAHLLLVTLQLNKAYSQADTLQLVNCYEQARNLSPLKKQELLNKNIYELGLKNQQTNYLPGLSVNGKASYQSEVISIPGSAMIPEYPVIPKEQFQVSVDIHQNIYDGGMTRHAKDLEESQWKVNAAELEIELYAIRSTINELYFSILQLQESEGIINTTLNNLDNQKKLVAAGVKNGIVQENNLYQIEKQILTLQQEMISIKSDKKVLSDLLSEWVGQPVDSNTVLKRPHFNVPVTDLPVNRPENNLFMDRRSLLESRMAITNAERRPRVSAFAQGGIGQPNPMNFFEVDPSAYYILGVRLHWPVFDWGDVSRKKQIIGLQRDLLDSRESDFNRNINMALTRNSAEIEKLKKVVNKDEEIISLQQKIVKIAFAELQHGVITSTEYLTELNALTEAEIKKVLHEVQLSKAHVNTYTSSGNEFK